MKIVVINLVIFFGLIFLTFFFEFLVLGWGASANSPDSNISIVLALHLIVVGILAFKESKKTSKKGYGKAFILLLMIFLFMKFVTDSI